jgi:hypothetical protein
MLLENKMSASIHKEDFVAVNGINGEFRVVKVCGEDAYVENVSGEGSVMLAWVDVSSCERIDEDE